MTDGEKLIKLRTEKGISQHELAMMLGYGSRSTINKIEVGERGIPLEMIKRLISVFGLSPYYFFEEETNEDTNWEEIINKMKSLSSENLQKVVSLIEELTD